LYKLKLLLQTEYITRAEKVKDYKENEDVCIFDIAASIGCSYGSR